MLNWKHVIALFAALALPASAHAYEAWRGPTGLLKHTEEKSFDGYTVLAPLGSTKTFLIDNDANIINVWESEYRNGIERDHAAQRAFAARIDASP